MKDYHLVIMKKKKNKLGEFHDKYLTKILIMYREKLLEEFHQESMETNYSIGMLMDKMDLEKYFLLESKRCLFNLPL